MATVDVVFLAAVAVLGWGQGGTGPPNLAQAGRPPNFHKLTIGHSSSARCCLPNDEGPGPPNIFS